MSREFHYKWNYELIANPEALWPLVSDTNRFNRDTRLPPMDLLGIEQGVRHIRYRSLLLPLEWDEEPFEWTYPFRFGILRRYRKGPMAEMRVECRLEPRQPYGTHLTYEIWAKPKGALGSIAIPFVIGLINANVFRSVFLQYDRIAQRAEKLLPVVRGRRLSAASHRRYRLLNKEMAEQGVEGSILNRMYEYIHQADDISVQRIRPYALADGWNLPRRPVLEAFLRGTRLGLFDMYWDLLCPNCRGVSESRPRLSLVHANTHCNTCQIDYSANFDHNVEVIFRINPVIRKVDSDLEFCVGSPQRQPHIVFSLIVPPGEELPLKTYLSPGRHSLRAAGLSGSQPLLAAEKGPDYLEIPASSSGWQREEVQIGLSPYLKLINQTDQPHVFELTRTAWSDQAATAADVTTLQLFRDLFSSEVLQPGEEISVGSVTLMFTDLRNSTRMYREIGDAPAFGRVRGHFDILLRSVTQQGGSIIKTMGDSVMAAFNQPAQALRALWKLQEQLVTQSQPALLLKAGIHRGTCIVVNLNDRLDYFGSVVNITAQLPSLSSGGEVVFSESVRNDVEVEEFLAIHVPTNALIRFQGSVKGLDEPINLWKLKI